MVAVHNSADSGYPVAVAAVALRSTTLVALLAVLLARTAVAAVVEGTPLRAALLIMGQLVVLAARAALVVGVARLVLVETRPALTVVLEVRQVPVL